MALAQVNIVPVGTDTASFSSYVAASYKVLEEDKNLKHQLTPTATVIEGEMDQVLQAVKKMQEASFAQGADRVITTITIDDRRDKPTSMTQAVNTVMHELH